MTKTKERNEIAALTPEKLAEMVNKQAHRLNEAIKRRKILSEKRAAAQAEEREAKEQVDEELNQLRALVDEDEAQDGLPFDGESERLLPTVFDEQDNQAIRAVRIEDLDLSAPIRSRLIESDDDCKKPQCITLGDLEQWYESGGRLNKIKTITDKKLPSIREAIRKACGPFTGDGEAEAA